MSVSNESRSVKLLDRFEDDGTRVELIHNGQRYAVVMVNDNGTFPVAYPTLAAAEAGYGELVELVAPASDEWNDDERWTVTDDDDRDAAFYEPAGPYRDAVFA